MLFVLGAEVVGFEAAFSGFADQTPVVSFWRGPHRNDGHEVRSGAASRVHSHVDCRRRIFPPAAWIYPDLSTFLVPSGIACVIIISWVKLFV